MVSLMTTLTTMKSRIAREVRRSDLTTQIAEAISSAIGSYQDQRWYFNESRDLTFSTVADQEFYSSTDDADIGLIKKIDYVKIYYDDNPQELDVKTSEHMEWLSQNGTQTGEPRNYCYYNRKIRLYPIPSEVYTVRVAGVIKLAEPATDGEANNAWMIDGERLIRSRAKYELALHVLRDKRLAEEMGSAVQEAEAQLRRDTIQQTATEGWLVTATKF